MSAVVSEVLVQIVVPTLGSVLAVVVPLLLHRLLALARERWNVQVSREQEAKLEALLQKAVQYAESRGIAAIKRGAPVEASGGERKALDALNFLVVEAKAAGLPELAEARLQMLLQAKFAELTAAGALPKASPPAAGPR